MAIRLPFHVCLSTKAMTADCDIQTPSDRSLPFPYYVRACVFSLHTCRYFSMNKSGSTQQSGVFRVNCIDCLDRTNVVEGLLAKRSLKQQLVKLGILTPTDQIETQTTFDYVFRNGKGLGQQ